MQDRYAGDIGDFMKFGLLRALADDLLATKPPAEALATWLRALIDFGRTKRSLSAALLATMSRDSELISSCSATMVRWL